MVIRLSGDMIIALDANGEQVPACQGSYGDVKNKILREATTATKFYQENSKGNLIRVAKKHWGQTP